MEAFYANSRANSKSIRKIMSCGNLFESFFMINLFDNDNVEKFP